MKDFQVFPLLDSALLSSEESIPYASKSPAVWPSEASAVRTDKSLWNNVGKCHRAAYYRMMGFNVTNPVGAPMCWRWVTGRQIESHLTELTKLTTPKIYVAHGVKLWVADLAVSLEIDVVTRDPESGRGCIIECKTYYGYNAAKEIVKEGHPKPENLMQVCLYLAEVRTGKRLKELIHQSLAERVRLDDIGIPHRYRCEADLEMVDKLDDGPVSAKLTYISRDDCQRTEFNIEIGEDFDGSHYPVVNGLPYKLFCIESIYSRYETLQGYWFRSRGEAVRRLAQRGVLAPEHLQLILDRRDITAEKDGPVVHLTAVEKKAEVEYLHLLEEEVRNLPMEFLPPCEYEWSYSPGRVEQLFEAGAVGKTNYAKYQKGTLDRLGDFNCNYCSYLNECLKTQRPDLVYQIADLNNVSDDVEVAFG